MKVWLSLGFLLAIGGAAYGCAAGEDNTDVQVAEQTTLPTCSPGPGTPERASESEPPNGESTGDQGSASSSGVAGDRRADGQGSDAGAQQDCVVASSSGTTSQSR